MEHRREFIENCPYGKHIGKILDQQNGQERPQAQKPLFLGQEAEKHGKLVPNFEKFGKSVKDAPKKTCAEWIIHFSKRAREVPK